MSTRRLPLLLLLILAPVAGVAATRRAFPDAPAPVAETRPPAARVRDTYIAGVDSLTAAVARLPTATHGTAAAALAAYRRARRAYKRIEYLVADLPSDAELVLNGPPLPRPHETTVDATVPPTGLQVIEAALVPTISPDADSIVRRQLTLIAPTLASLRNLRGEPATADSRFFDAVRREIARVSTLGIAGFDATITHDGIMESAEALRGVRLGLEAYRPANTADSAWVELDRRLAAAIAVLDRDHDFDRFDRLGFLSGNALPLAAALSRFQTSLGFPRTSPPTAWFTHADAIYDPGAVDPFDYAPSDATPLRANVLALGRRLFFDTRLSASGRRSCATCHQPGRAFTDGRVLPLVDPGAGPVRNVPTLLNAALQPFQFADQRSRSLEDQAAAVLANPREMNFPLDRLVPRLRADSSLADAFAAVYAVPRDDAITARRVQTALAAFVRSLVAVRSRFDRAVAGDALALTPEERRGFNLFMGKAACGTCHFAPTFGGSLPPGLLESEPEVIGVPSRPVTSGATVDPDSGAAGYDHVPIHRHAFKTPSLRNVALTAPYMHNGVYRTLDQVVDFYDRGGGAGIGVELPNQTLSPSPLHLTRSEKGALVTFMRALTDTVVTVPR